MQGFFQVNRVLFHNCSSLLRLFEAIPIKRHSDSVPGNTTKVTVAMHNSYLIVFLGYISI